MLKEVNRAVFFSGDTRIGVAMIFIMAAGFSCAQNRSRDDLQKNANASIRISVSKKDSFHKINSSYKSRVFRKRRDHAN